MLTNAFVHFCIFTKKCIFYGSCSLADHVYSNCETSFVQMCDSGELDSIGQLRLLF